MWCSSFAHIIGVSVSDTTAEIRIDTASVIANSRNSRPTTSPMNSSGISTAISENVSEMIVNAICCVPFERRLERRIALLDVARDVLDDDDRVVDDESRWRWSSAISVRLLIEKPGQVHHAERADQRQRHRDARDERRRQRCAGTGRSPSPPAPRRAAARTARRCTDARMVTVRSVSSATSTAAGSDGLQLRQQLLRRGRRPR